MNEYVVEGPSDGSSSWSVRESIVRCRDCKHFETNIHGSYCKKSISIISNSNGFCAWGEKRKMSEHMFFQGNPSGKADDAQSELSTLSVLCELLGKVDALEQCISDVNDANLYGLSKLEERIDSLEQRIEVMERKLNHKGGKE